MTRIIYMVDLDFQRKVGSVMFEDEGTAKLYAHGCQAQGLNALVIPRILILDTSEQYMMSNEVKLAK